VPLLPVQWSWKRIHIINGRNNDQNDDNNHARRQSHGQCYWHPSDKVSISGPPKFHVQCAVPHSSAPFHCSTQCLSPRHSHPGLWADERILCRHVLRLIGTFAECVWLPLRESEAIKWNVQCHRRYVGAPSPGVITRRIYGHGGLKTKRAQNMLSKVAFH